MSFVVMTFVVMSFVEPTLGGFLDSFRIEMGHQKEQTMIRSLELSALPSSFRKGRGARDRVNN